MKKERLIQILKNKQKEIKYPEIIHPKKGRLGIKKNGLFKRVIDTRNEGRPVGDRPEKDD